MSTGAAIFMLGTWAAVIALNIYCFYKLLSNRKRQD
jgi:hypothetical protein